MTQPANDRGFAGSIPRIYETHLVPLIFESYAIDLVRRLEAVQPLACVLEIAAGTGVVTRKMASVLPRQTAIIATDLNQAMLELASEVGTARPVEWRQADAMELPFDDGSFEAVVCQFGVMFFPDKAKAFAEVRRVLKPRGVFIFNVWDRIEENELPAVISAAVADLFPHDPPTFLPRMPYGYYDRGTIERDLAAGGFTAPAKIETVTARSRAPDARVAAKAFCEGTPLRNEIEARDASRLAAATDSAARALARRFGEGPVDGKIQAHLVTAVK